VKASRKENLILLTLPKQNILSVFGKTGYFSLASKIFQLHPNSFTVRGEYFKISENIHEYNKDVILYAFYSALQGFLTPRRDKSNQAIDICQELEKQILAQ
jgi:hypothetical protein